MDNKDILTLNKNLNNLNQKTMVLRNPKAKSKTKIDYRQEALDEIIKIAKNKKKNDNFKEDDLVAFSDIEGKCDILIDTLIKSGIITNVRKEGDKINFDLNDKFCGTILFPGDLTCYFRGQNLEKNELTVEIFETLLEKIKKHNENKETEKQIQFIAVPGNHEFLGFEGNGDFYSIGNTLLDVEARKRYLKNKLNGIKIIEKIQENFLQQQLNNKQCEYLFDDDYDNQETKTSIKKTTEEKIKNLQNEIKSIEETIEAIENSDDEQFKNIKEDVGQAYDALENIILNNNNGKKRSKIINDDRLESLKKLKFLNFLIWPHSQILSKIVFAHNKNKFRVVHHLSLYCNNEYYAPTLPYFNDEKILKNTMQENINHNPINITNSNIKHRLPNNIFNNNKIATIEGHEHGTSKATNKVLCIDKHFDLPNEHIAFPEQIKKIYTYRIDKENKVYHIDNYEKYYQEKTYDQEETNKPPVILETLNCNPISTFIENGEKINEKDITAENIIRYMNNGNIIKNRGNFITRNLGFNRRQKARCDALCEVIEELTKENQTNTTYTTFKNNFKNLTKQQEDSIKGLFNCDNDVKLYNKKNINNDTPKNNLSSIKQRISAKLNQVGCFC